MEKIKLLLLKLPEFYLLVLAILSCYTPPFSFNPIIMGLVAVMILQLVFENKIAGRIIAGMLLLINMYMLAALLSEFREFTTINSDAIQLLLGGLLLFGLNFCMAGIMLYKYAVKKDLKKMQLS